MEDVVPSAPVAPVPVESPVKVPKKALPQLKINIPEQQMDHSYGGSPCPSPTGTIR